MAEQLQKMAENNGLINIQCKVTSKENRKPHFEVITLEAVKK
jgi:hypothetical protein